MKIKTKIGLISILIIGMSAYAFRHTLKKMWIKVPTSAEFFAQNPGLNPAPGINAEPAPASDRENFSAHDYHFLPGDQIEVTFSQLLNAKQKSKTVFNSLAQGKVIFHGITKSANTLALIAEFKFTKVTLPGSKESFSSTLGIKPSNLYPSVPKQFHHAIWIEVDFAGALKGAHALELSKAKPQAEDELNADFLELDMIEAILKRLPQATSGTATLTERNEQGDLGEVRYQITDAGPLRTFTVAQKTDTKNSNGADPRFAALTIAITSAQDRLIEWRTQDGIPQSQKMDVSVDATYVGTQVSSFDYHLNATWGRFEKSGFTADDQKWFPYEINLAELRSRKADSRQLSKNKNAKSKNKRALSWLESRAQLNKVDGANTTEDERSEILIGYSDALKQNPSLLKAAKDDLNHSTPGSRETSVILGALGFVGTPAAQAILAEAYGRTGIALQDQEKILAEFTLPVEALTPESKSFLQSVYHDSSNPDLAKMASFALGSSIAKDGDPNIVTLFKKDWQSSYGVFGDGTSEETKKSNLLLAMGNSKSNVFFDEVKEASNSSNPMLKNNAIDALRFNTDDASRTLLLNTLQKDPSEAIRTTAARSLSYQPFDLKTKIAATTCSSSDSSVAVKMECYHFLADHVADPEVRKFLEGRTSAEPDSRVQVIITQALQLEQVEK